MCVCVCVCVCSLWLGSTARHASLSGSLPGFPKPRGHLFLVLLLQAESKRGKMKVRALASGLSVAALVLFLGQPGEAVDLHREATANALSLQAAADTAHSHLHASATTATEARAATEASAGARPRTKSTKKEGGDEKPTAVQVDVIVDSLRTMFGLDGNTSVSDVMAKLARTAESTAANKAASKAADSPDAQDAAKVDSEVSGVNGATYDLSSVEAVEESLVQMAASSRKVAAALRKQANDAVTAEQWAEAEKMQATYQELERQADELLSRSKCASESVLPLGKADPCALPMLQKFARERLGSVLQADKMSMTDTRSTEDISFAGLRKIFGEKMKLAVSSAGRSLSDDRRILQVLSIVRLLDKLVELENKLAVAKAAQEFSRGRLLQTYFDSSKAELTKVWCRLPSRTSVRMM